MAWAGSGECEKNTVFMESNCALSCQKVVDAREEYARRCPTPADRMPALANGAMNATFERIMSGHFAELQPEMINEDPPVVRFQHFLRPGEAEVFIKHGEGSMANVPSMAGQSAPSQPLHLAIFGPRLLYTLWRSHGATPLALRGSGAVVRRSRSRSFRCL